MLSAMNDWSSLETEKNEKEKSEEEVAANKASEALSNSLAQEIMATPEIKPKTPPEDINQWLAKASLEENATKEAAAAAEVPAGIGVEDAAGAP